MEDKFNIAVAQISPIFADISANVEKHLSWIESAKKKKADIVVFPELGISGYALKDLSSEIAIKPYGDELKPIRDASFDIGVVVSFPELCDDCISYISSAFFYQGELIHLYRKVHPPTHGMFEEIKYFGVGSQIRAFDTSWSRMGMMICRDIWHPEMAFTLSADGAMCIIASSAIPARNIGPEGFGVQQSMKRTIQNMALTNQCWVILSNRVGTEDGVVFLGGSMVCSPNGNVVCEFGLLEEDLQIATIDMQQLRRDRDSLNLVRERKTRLILDHLKRIVDGY